MALALAGCGSHYESTGSTSAPGSESFVDNPPSAKAHCAYVDQRGGYGGDWVSPDYLICVERKGRFCYGHTSLLSRSRPRLYDIASLYVPLWLLIREIPDGLPQRLWNTRARKGVIPVSTMHAPPVHAHRLHVDPWHVAVVVLAAALVALGAWVVIDNVTGGDSATDNATALIDDFNAASMANDGAKAMTMMTPDAVLWSNGDVITGAPAWGDAINTTPTLVLDRIAPVSVNGDYATTLVRYGVPGVGLEPRTSVFVYQLRDGKIARAWAWVTGVTEPMTNIAR